ncbi:MAG: hypothetical protein ACRDU4_05490 [Mycobacterium sp.]
MTDTAPTATTPTWTRWLYPLLAATGIAVGIFIIAAGLYLLIAHPGSHKDCCEAKGPATTASQAKDCCEAMKADMKGMKMPMQNMPSMPSMSPMPNMPMPTPSR